MSVRRWCLLLLVLAVLVYSGCSADSNISDTVSDIDGQSVSGETITSFSLAYSAQDTLDPFHAKTEANWYLATLLYDSLTVIDSSFSPHNSLAQSIEWQDPTHMAVSVCTGASFSDGTAVRPADIVYSFQQAKASANYKELLSNIVSATLDRQNGTVIFGLSSPDKDAMACLSFPVIREKTSTASPEKAAIGGGLYVFTPGEDGATLERNRYSKVFSHFASVGLRDLPNTTTMFYGLSSGNITYYFDDLNSGTIHRVSGSSATVNMNDLIYLGINGGKSPLDSSEVRQALSQLIDRKTLSGSAFSAWALPAVSPFHPAWENAKGLECFSESRSLTGAVERLKKSGHASDLKLELIYSTDGGARSAAAEQLRSDFESAGVQVTVTPLPYENYLSRLKSGKYDLYLGEIRLTANMDLSPLLGGKMSYGMKKDGKAVLSYGRYRSGEITADEFSAVFADDLPYIPLCWRCGFAAYDRRLGTVTPHGFNVYYGFADWH